MNGRRRPAALLALLLVASLAPAAGCGRSKPAAKPAPPLPAPLVRPDPAPPAPLPLPPGAASMAEADLALQRGDLAASARALDLVIAIEPPAPARLEALWRRAVLAARPDNAGRDPALSKEILRELLESRPSPAREADARLILALLALEEAAEREVADLRARVEAGKTESEDLRATLAQREEELRKIKEILLEKRGAP